MDGSSQNGPGGVNGNSQMSRAERFEDEKRRIIDSCFGKKDDDGARKPFSGECASHALELWEAGQLTRCHCST